MGSGIYEFLFLYIYVSGESVIWYVLRLNRWIL